MDNEKLYAALDAAKLAALPAEADIKDQCWLKALALVLKADGSRNYALVRHNADGTIGVVRDFGNISIIAKVLSIHPYESSPRPEKADIPAPAPKPATKKKPTKTTKKS